MAVAFGLSLVSNVVFGAGLIGGKNVGQISRENPTFITPDSMTFAIWGVIYSLELLMVVIANTTASSRFQGLLSGPPGGLQPVVMMTIAFVFNGLWLPAYVYLENFELSFVILAAYLVALLAAYRTLNPLAAASVPEWVSYGAGISCNISWAIVATSANLFNVLGGLGIIDANGVAGTVVLAQLVIGAATVVATVVAVNLLDTAWPAVGAWALMGVYRMQLNPNPNEFPVASQSQLLAAAAFYSSIALAVIAVGAFIRFAVTRMSKNRSLLLNPIE